MILHVTQIVLKAKRGSQWFDLKQFVDANKICDFFTMTSELRIRFHELKMEWQLRFCEFLWLRSHELRFCSQNFEFVCTNSWGFSACYVANSLYCMSLCKDYIWVSTEMLHQSGIKVTLICVLHELIWLVCFICTLTSTMLEDFYRNCYQPEIEQWKVA